MFLFDYFLINVLCLSSIEYLQLKVKINNIFKHKTVNIFLPISHKICFGCSQEPSHWDGSFEYPQHMFWLRNKKINFSVHTLN